MKLSSLLLYIVSKVISFIQWLLLSLLILLLFSEWRSTIFRRISLIIILVLFILFILIISIALVLCISQHSCTLLYYLNFIGKFDSIIAPFNPRCFWLWQLNTFHIKFLSQDYFIYIRYHIWWFNKWK